MLDQWVKSRAFGLALALGAGLSSNATAVEVNYKFIDVHSIKIFYREAGDPQKPTILLLHGFPSSSQMFRDLIPELDEHFHVLAPDYPGMGNSEAPPAEKFKASFDSVADVIEQFVQEMNVSSAILYMQDFGGPVGLRLATRHPEWVRGIVIQNSPISLDGWEPSRLKAIQDSTGPETPEKRAAAESRVVFATDLFLHKHGAHDPATLNPDAWTNDAFALNNAESRRIMTDLQLDISSNLALYPKWQDYLRTHQPKTLVVWGDGDPIFVPRGADAIDDLVLHAEVRHYHAGHFALEEEHGDIARQIIRVFGE
ncbi:alpha/beta hydrolase [Hyphomicrobium sp. 802]|uniref:alpha/beta fold hydrolase n=1 Tax=Hyphomicrobium sp. 802 TaxID=1112272 RepID=UPI00045EA6BA|nr:alpha/beta hydrolase [Hyphomicrobium sp. 802]